MAVYTETKTYHTKAHMGMIDVTEDFHHAVEEAARQKNIRNGHDHRFYHRRRGGADHAGI